MKRKILKGSFITTLIVALFFVITAIFALNTNVYASSEINVDEIPSNSNFSEYVNLVKNGTYYSEIVISTFENTDSYQPCKEINDSYPNKTIKRTNPKNVGKYGFKVNGEFYINTCEITESGTYKIQVVSKVEKLNEIKAGSVIETFNINVALDYKIQLTKTTFYVENYETPSFTNFTYDLLNSINRMDDDEIYIDNKSDLEQCFQGVNQTKVNETFKVNFKKNNFTYPTEINLCSIKNITQMEKNDFSETKDDFLENVNKDLKMDGYAQLTCAFAYENLSNINQTLTKYLYARIKRGKAQDFSFTVNYDELNSRLDNLTSPITSDAYTTASIYVTIKSNSLKSNIQFEISCIIYNLEYVLKTQTEYNFGYLDLLTKEYNKTDSPQLILQNIVMPYISVNVSNSFYGVKDFSIGSYLEAKILNANNSAINKEGKWNSAGDKEICIDFNLNFYNEDYNAKIKDNIKVINNSEIKILTKYNVILLSSLNDLSTIKDQVKAVSNEPIQEIKDIDYTFDNEKKAIIFTAKLGDKTATKIVAYQIDDTYKDNWWLNFLYSYKKFLKNIF